MPLTVKKESYLNRGSKELGAKAFLEWGAIDAWGTAGELAVFWDSETLELLDKEIRAFSLM